MRSYIDKTARGKTHSIWQMSTRVRILFIVASLLILLEAARFTCGVPGSTEELLQYGSQLQLGDSMERARASLPDGMFSHLTARTDKDGVLVVSTPYRLGASNWVLLLEFDEGGLKSMLYRYEDNARRRPPESPPDRQR